MERCQQIERARLLRMLERARDDFGSSFKDTVNRALKDPLSIDALKLMIKNFDTFTIRAAKILLQSHPDRPVGLRRDMHNFRRYRRETEGRRRKALAAWI